jgi:hypothetical protein
MAPLPPTVACVADNKTMPTAASVDDFLAAVANQQMREDSAIVRSMMQATTGHHAVMWGESIVGFGCEPYRYASGRQGQWPIMAFAPRKSELTLYGLHSSYEPTNPLQASLGKFRSGVGCLYVRRLNDVDLDVLKALMVKAAATHRLKGRDVLPAIGMPAARALADIGVSRLSDVLAFTSKELLALHGFGPKALRILENALNAESLSLRD